MQIITPETLEALASALTSLSVGESVCVTANDFKKLTGDDLTTFAAEGRLMIGNVSARTNCTIVTAGKLVIFTKNTHPNIHPHTADEAEHFS
jgi:hypothetical protein